MADTCEESSSEGSEGSDSDLSDNFSIYSESSTSDEDEQNGEASASRSSARKRKSRSEKSTSSSKQTAKKTKTKRPPNVLNDDQMEELTSWIFSTQEASDVEGSIREKLLESQRVKSVKERERFAKHLISEQQKANFQLLIVGFCRKFSTLVSECYLLPDKPNRKAAFSVAWMKMLGNFQAGKDTQERLIIKRFLVGQSQGQQFSPEVVHAVVSVIHELVYCTIHSHVQVKKSISTSELRNSPLAVESDDTLFRYCGAALHRMIKLRKETLQQKKGRGKVSSERRPVMEKEMDVLNTLVMKDKSSLSSSLKNLDEGNLIFPRIELLPFLKEVDKNVREFTSDANLAKYPSRFINMCQTSVINNESLEMDFKLLVASITTMEGDRVIDDEVVCGLFRALVSKLANTRINEFLNAKVERDLKASGKVVDADEMLRPKLKSYSLAAKRK